MISFGNIHTDNIAKTDQVVLMHLRAHTHIHSLSLYSTPTFKVCFSLSLHKGEIFKGQKKKTKYQYNYGIKTVYLSIKTIVKLYFLINE